MISFRKANSLLSEFLNSAKKEKENALISLDELNSATKNNLDSVNSSILEIWRFCSTGKSFEETSENLFNFLNLPSSSWLESINFEKKELEDQISVFDFENSLVSLEENQAKLKKLCDEFDSLEFKIISLKRESTGKFKPLSKASLSLNIFILIIF